jgi:hypothetical protein
MLRPALAVVLVVPIRLGWTVIVRRVLVSDRREEVDLVLWKQECSREGVNGCVAPSFVIEAACRIEMIEVRPVRGRTPEVEVGDLEVRPDYTTKQISRRAGTGEKHDWQWHML